MELKYRRPPPWLTESGHPQVPAAQERLGGRQPHGLLRPGESDDGVFSTIIQPSYSLLNISRACYVQVDNAYSNTLLTPAGRVQGC